MGNDKIRLRKQNAQAQKPTLSLKEDKKKKPKKESGTTEKQGFYGGSPKEII